MGMMTKESHPFYIKSQLTAAACNSSQSQPFSEDMNFDIDNEAISYSQPYDSFSSPTKPLLVVTVDWANSQPVALESLLSEVRKIPPCQDHISLFQFSILIFFSFYRISRERSNQLRAFHQPSSLNNILCTS